MKTLKESIYIAVGSLLFIAGLLGVLVFALVNDFETSTKIAGTAGSILVVLFGWWLVRRGSKSIPDAIHWIIEILFPW